MAQIAQPVQGNGLLLDVRIGVSALRRQQLWKRSMPVPPAVTVTLIVDTGADTTMINDQFMRTLGLSPTSQARVLSSESAGVPKACDMYDVGLEILNLRGGPSWTLQPLAVMGRPLLNQGTDGMLGRDVLGLCVLHYDGPRGTFTLDYPDRDPRSDE